MKRDEILDAIKSAATLDPADTGPDEIQSAMRSVAQLAEEWRALDTADEWGDLGAALVAALDSFADALQPYA